MFDYLTSGGVVVTEHPAREGGQDRWKVMTHTRYMVFQMVEVAMPRDLFGRILAMIYDLRPDWITRC